MKPNPSFSDFRPTLAPTRDEGPNLFELLEESKAAPTPTGVNRRGFFKIAASVTAFFAFITHSISALSPSKRKHRYGMVINTKRCIGCRACVIACKAENKTPPGVNYNMVLDHVLESFPDDKPIFMTKPCFHCENAPCVDVCPVSATFKREQDGIVVVDYDRCIGCRYCITACPYGARSFDFGENYAAVAANMAISHAPSPEYQQFRQREHDASPVGNVRKCTFCMHLQDESGKYDVNEGRWPACAKTCTAHAIAFGDFNDPESEVSRLLKERQMIRLKEELGTRPNVYYEL